MKINGILHINFNESNLKNNISGGMGGGGGGGSGTPVHL